MKEIILGNTTWAYDARNDMLLFILLVFVTIGVEWLVIWLCFVKWKRTDPYSLFLLVLIGNVITGVIGLGLGVLWS